MTAPITPPLLAFPGNRRPLLVMEPYLIPVFAKVGPPYTCVGDVAWTEVGEKLRRAPATTLIIVDPYAGVRRGERFPKVRDLLRRFPSVPVVCAMELSAEVALDMGMLLDWGISDVAALGPESTPFTLARRLQQAHARPFKRAVEGTLSQYVGADARQILMAAAEVAAEGGQAQELATRLRVTVHTLGERCMRSEVPPARQVQAWMRLLLACMLLDDPGRTVYGAAYASGYQTDRSLRRAITTMLGVDSTALRRAGAFATAARAFNAVLRDAREAARERRRAALVLEGLKELGIAGLANGGSGTEH
jgi:methylphosphotriester-DNA--protein-cysteine methyltransferase